MTHFEKTYLLFNRQHNIAIADSNKEHSKEYYVKQMQQKEQQFRMQLEYRELDRLSMELEKELKAVKALRVELEKFKMDFSVSVQDEATKKIQEVLKNIDKLFK